MYRSLSQVLGWLTHPLVLSAWVILGWFAQAAHTLGATLLWGVPTVVVGVLLFIQHKLHQRRS